MQLAGIAVVMKVCATHHKVLWELKNTRGISMTDLARKLSVQNPKALSRPLNDLEKLGLVDHTEQDNPRGGLKLKFWSLSARAERLLTPFWRENDEPFGPVAPQEKRIELNNPDPSEVQFYLGKVLNKKARELVRNEAMRGLLTLCREHHLPLCEKAYTGVLEGLRVLLENRDTAKDLRDDVLRTLEAIEYNCSLVRDKKTINCIRDNFLRKLKELQRTDPWRATPALDALVPEEEKFSVYMGLMKHWMEDVIDDETYMMHLQCLLPHVTAMCKRQPKDVRDWLFGLMENPNERLSSRAASLNRILN